MILIDSTLACERARTGDSTCALFFSFVPFRIIRLSHHNDPSLGAPPRNKPVTPPLCLLETTLDENKETAATTTAILF